MRLRISILGGALFALAACAALPTATTQELRDEYIERTRELGFNPVYPPSEEWQVGDVYFFSHPVGRLDDVDDSARIHLGTITSVREDANEYLASRINFDNTSTDTSTDETRYVQADFSSGGIVGVNAGNRSSLPLVAFPSVEGSASSAASLGGIGIGSAFRIGFGQSERVTVDFGDTRVFGLPSGAFSMDLEDLRDEYVPLICGTPDEDGRWRQLERIFNRAFLVIEERQYAEGRDRMAANELCGEGRICQFLVITRTYQTRSIGYNYTGSAITSLAAARARGEISDTSGTPQIAAPDVNLTINVSEETPQTQIDALVAALNANAANVSGDTPSSTLQFLGFRGNSMSFRRNLQKPVALAFDAARYNLDGDGAACRLEVNDATGVITHDDSGQIWP